MIERNSINPTVAIVFSKRYGGVEYRLAEGSGDFRKVRKFLDANVEETVPRLSFPTIVAEKDGEIIGVCGTNIKQQTIFQGPLALKRDRPRRFTALRLIDAYDAVMRLAGISMYAVYVDRQNIPLKDLFQKTFEIEPYASTDEGFYYLRKL